jgi:hypothetical protein
MRGWAGLIWLGIGTIGGLLSALQIYHRFAYSVRQRPRYVRNERKKCYVPVRWNISDYYLLEQ